MLLARVLGSSKHIWKWLIGDEIRNNIKPSPDSLCFSDSWVIDADINKTAIVCYWRNCVLVLLIKMYLHLAEPQLQPLKPLSYPPSGGPEAFTRTFHKNGLNYLLHLWWRAATGRLAPPANVVGQSASSALQVASVQDADIITGCGLKTGTRQCTKARNSRHKCIKHQPKCVKPVITTNN